MLISQEHKNLEFSIQTIVDRIVSDLLNDSDTIEVTYSNSSGLKFDPILMINIAEYSKSSSVKLSKRTFRSFCRLIRLMKISCHLIQTSQTLSLRAIYYSAPLHFPSYDMVRDTVDKLERVLDCSRDMMNITASSKGLIATGIGLNYSLGEFAIANAAAVPANFKPNFQFFSQEIPSWILVVEKDSVFNRLFNFGLQNGVVDDYGVAVLPRGVIVTGKGFPDIATRALLRALSDSFTSTPVFCLVDYNPHGMLIYETYCHGSQSKTRDNIALSVPRMELIGLCNRDIQSWNCSLEKLTEKDFSVLKNLKNRDSIKFKNLLKNEIFAMNQKCDIESIGAENMDALFYYVVEKLKSLI